MATLIWRDLAIVDERSRRYIVDYLDVSYARWGRTRLWKLATELWI